MTSIDTFIPPSPEAQRKKQRAEDNEPVTDPLEIAIRDRARQASGEHATDIADSLRMISSLTPQEEKLTQGKLSPEDLAQIKDTANRLGTDYRLILAIMANEDSAFNGTKTRKERKLIAKLLRKNPNLNREDAGIMGTSYGYFQILGLSYREMGYATTQEFLTDITGNLASQLNVFERYCTMCKPQLLAMMRKKQLTQIASEYNGPRYRRNHYDKKLGDTLRYLEA
jgi:hypothetical protein